MKSISMICLLFVTTNAFAAGTDFSSPGTLSQSKHCVSGAVLRTQAEGKSISECAVLSTDVKVSIDTMQSLQKQTPVTAQFSGFHIKKLAVINEIVAF